MLYLNALLAFQYNLKKTKTKKKTGFVTHFEEMCSLLTVNPNSALSPLRPVGKVLCGALTLSTAPTWSRPWRSSTSLPHMPSAHHPPPHPGELCSASAPIALGQCLTQQCFQHNTLKCSFTIVHTTAMFWGAKKTSETMFRRELFWIHNCSSVVWTR